MYLLLQMNFTRSRKKCCVFMAVRYLILFFAFISIGYGALDFIQIFGMVFPDFFDFLTNSVMMPLAALATCFLILRVVGFKKISEEIEQSSSFRRKKLYTVFLKYLRTNLPDYYFVQFYRECIRNYFYVNLIQTKTGEIIYFPGFLLFYCPSHFWILLCRFDGISSFEGRNNSLPPHSIPPSFCCLFQIFFTYGLPRNGT